MTLHVHTGDRTDVLADALADLLAAPATDPFARESVVVPARGVERWLTQRLAHRLGVGPRGSDGVCAGVDFTAPHSLVSLLLGDGEDDPWHPDRVVWPLLEVIDASVAEAGFETLARHLGHEDHSPEGELRRSRRYATARRLAGVLSSYASQRPTILSAWESGADEDGLGAPLAEDLGWQPELWRRLVAHLGLPSPATRHRETLARLRDGDPALPLPARLSLFGHTRLPVTEIELLTALAAHREVHLWLPQVSGQLWRDLDAAAPDGSLATGPVRRREDVSALVVGHGLLASLGRDGRELHRSLGASARSAVHHGAPLPPESLLGWLQSDLRSNAAPGPDVVAGRLLDGDDRSVQVHSCHGAARQVDVLREVLVGLLADDPTLEPRDILVMCPDIESYAPLFQAAFGLADIGGDPHPAHQLRVRLADRSPGAANPLLGVAGALVDLASSRLSATQVLDLAAAQPVRARFGFTDEELERLAAWVSQAAIRWGHDASERTEYGLDLPDNTWLLGLRRLALGAAVSGQEHRVVGETLPVDDVGDSDLDLLGRFIEFVDRLHRFTSRARSSAQATDWAEAIKDAVQSMTATTREQSWQPAQFSREVDSIARAGRATGAHLRHADVRALFRDRLRPRPTRANFRTGTLTVATLVPMRSVPHRVICLVGLDDGVYPRVATTDGDDALARNPLTGERDLRAEDRQLLLDAVAAAGETLVVTYSGRGEHTGAPKPPAVPLGEILSALETTATATPAPDGSSRSVADLVVVEHPLQPFDESNLVPGRLVPGAPGHPFSFDRAALAGAVAARTPVEHIAELVPSPLPLVSPAEVSLADLLDFYAHPVRAFFRARLRVGAPAEADRISDDIPITLDALEAWDVGDRLLADVLAGRNGQESMRAERLRGQLPPGALGQRTLDEVTRKARPLYGQAMALRAGAERVLDVDVDLGGGRRLSGTVAGVYGNAGVSVSYSNLGAKHRLAGWIRALALGAGLEDENWTIHTVGKHRSGSQISMVAPLPHHEAIDWLRDLVELRDLGLSQPLRLPLKTSLAWAEEVRKSGDLVLADERAEREWASPRFDDGGFPKEDSDVWHQLAWGPRAAFDDLRGGSADGPEPPHVPPSGAPHRMGQLAWRLWAPLLVGAPESLRAGA